MSQLLLLLLSDFVFLHQTDAINIWELVIVELFNLLGHSRQIFNLEPSANRISCELAVMMAMLWIIHWVLSLFTSLISEFNR